MVLLPVSVVGICGGIAMIAIGSREVTHPNNEYRTMTARVDAVAPKKNGTGVHIYDDVVLSYLANDGRRYQVRQRVYPPDAPPRLQSEVTGMFRVSAEEEGPLLLRMVQNADTPPVWIGPEYPILVAFGIFLMLGCITLAVTMAFMRTDLFEPRYEHNDDAWLPSAGFGDTTLVLVDPPPFKYFCRAPKAVLALAVVTLIIGGSFLGTAGSDSVVTDAVVRSSVPVTDKPKDGQPSTYTLVTLAFRDAQQREYTHEMRVDPPNATPAEGSTVRVVYLSRDPLSNATKMGNTPDLSEPAAYGRYLAGLVMTVFGSVTTFIILLNSVFSLSCPDRATVEQERIRYLERIQKEKHDRESP